MFIVASIVCGEGLRGALVFVLLFSILCPSSFVIILMKEERAGCFALPVSLMSCDSQCTVALPYYAMGWSAVCDCGTCIS